MSEHHEVAVERGGERQWVWQFIEFLALVAGMIVLAGWLGWSGMGFMLSSARSLCDSSQLANIAGAAAFFGILSLPILLLVRYVPRRLAMVAGSFMWVVAVCAYLYLVKMLPVVREIRVADEFNLLPNSLMLDFYDGPVRQWLWALVSLVGGFYAVRRRFSYVRLIVGVAVTGYVSMLLFTPFAFWPGWWLAPVCFAAFAALMVSLPGQRAALERLTGTPLRKRQGAAQLRYANTPWGLAGHFAVVVLALAGAASAVINYHERAQVDVFEHGPAPVWHSPAKTNAYADLQELFRKDDSVTSGTVFEHPDDYEQALKLISQISTGTRERILTTIDVAGINGYISGLSDYIRAFDAAGKADYLQLPGPDQLSYLNLRETARPMGIRSQLALREGQIKEAVDGVAAMYRMGGLMRDQPNLVTQMVGAAIRSIGNNVAWNLLAAAPENAELLDGLAVVLKEVAPVMRVGLDVPALRRGEPGLMGGVVTPNVSIIMPALGRAQIMSLVKWMDFDMVQIGVALERFRKENNKYPVELLELKPGYLKRIPRDPFAGQEYRYRMISADRYELKHSLPEGKKEADFTPLTMPPMAYADGDQS